MSMTLHVVIPPHPVVGHWLSILRMPSTPPTIYTTALEQIGKWLTYESLRDWLPYKKEKISTTHGDVEGLLIEARVPLLAFPNTPGGMYLWLGAKELISNSRLCLGSVPDEIDANAGIIIFFDQITNGQDLLKTLMKLKSLNVDMKRVRVVSALVSSPGLVNVGEKFPDLTIYAGCIDPELINDEECSPGIGNCLNRINTTISQSD